jgi:hypothetical protein
VQPLPRGHDPVLARSRHRLVLYRTWCPVLVSTIALGLDRFRAREWAKSTNPCTTCFAAFMTASMFSQDGVGASEIMRLFKWLQGQEYNPEYLGQDQC